MAPAAPACDRQSVRRRADYFLRSALEERAVIADFASKLDGLGPLAIIGGMLRDLCLVGIRGFHSDVDFVSHPASLSEFDRRMRSLGAEVNRFGGYRIPLGIWKADVWALQRTWASVHGHADVRTFDDLQRVTYFDWDAILYEIRERRVIAADNYFDHLRQRLLDVNLTPNPNPLGNAVRALRYAWRWEASFGTELASQVLRQIAESSWETLLDAERVSFSNRFLSNFNNDVVTSKLKRAVRTGNRVRLRKMPQQYELPL